MKIKGREHIIRNAQMKENERHDAGRPAGNDKDDYSQNKIYDAGEKREKEVDVRQAAHRPF